MGGSTSPPPTTITTAAATPPRLRRENFRHTKHDSAFSKWKVLIGPNDWADYRAQKEGAERYRVGNLPTVIGPGVYEIGVAVCSSFSGRVVDKLDPDRIVVVYLGQADNGRSRLQDYGRCGSHLVAGFGLFKEVFSRGYLIPYRWAPLQPVDCGREVGDSCGSDGGERAAVVPVGESAEEDHLVEGV